MSPSQPGPKGPDTAQAGARETSIPTCTCEVTPGVSFASVNARMATTAGPAHLETCPLYRRTFGDAPVSFAGEAAVLQRVAAVLDSLPTREHQLRAIAIACLHCGLYGMGVDLAAQLRAEYGDRPGEG